MSDTLEVGCTGGLITTHVQRPPEAVGSLSKFCSVSSGRPGVPKGQQGRARRAGDRMLSSPSHTLPPSAS